MLGVREASRAVLLVDIELEHEVEDALLIKRADGPALRLLVLVLRPQAIVRITAQLTKPVRAALGTDVSAHLLRLVVPQIHDGALGRDFATAPPEFTAAALSVPCWYMSWSDRPSTIEPVF